MTVDQIKAAIAANDAKGKSLQQLAIDQGTLDGAQGKKSQHAQEALDQAQTDSQDVATATAVVSTDLTDLAAKQQAESDLIGALLPAPVTAPPAA